MINLRFESRLKATQEQVWQSITSLEGLTSEMMPLMKLTAPQGFKTLSDIFPRKNDFRSWVLLFGFIPFDHTDLKLKSLTVGKGFVEESNMGSMKSWRHVRTLVPHGDREVSVIDELTFEPKRFKSITKLVIQKFFEHRHKQLRRKFL